MTLPPIPCFLFVLGPSFISCTLSSSSSLSFFLSFSHSVADTRPRSLYLFLTCPPSLHLIQFISSRNLIDIPSTLQLERLQQQEAQNRSNEYISALNTVKLPEQTIKKLHSMTSVVKAGADIPIDFDATTLGSSGNGGLKSAVSSAGNSVKAPSVREVLAEKTIDSKTLGWVSLS